MEIGVHVLPKKDNLNRIRLTFLDTEVRRPKGFIMVNNHAKKVMPGENWGSDITLTTKAPINISSLYTFTKSVSDSVFISIHSTILAGSYLNGQQNGTVILDQTSAYDVQEIEHYMAIKK